MANLLVRMPPDWTDSVENLKELIALGCGYEGRRFARCWTQEACNKLLDTYPSAQQMDEFMSPADTLAWRELEMSVEQRAHSGVSSFARLISTPAVPEQEVLEPTTVLEEEEPQGPKVGQGALYPPRLESPTLGEELRDLPSIATPRKLRLYPPKES